MLMGTSGWEYSIRMSATPIILMARSRRLRRVVGMPDVLTLRLEALVPPGRERRTVVVEQRLSKRDVERILAAFERYDV